MSITKEQPTSGVWYGKPFTLSKPEDPETVIFWNIEYPGYDNREKLVVRVPKWKWPKLVEDPKGEESKSKFKKYKVFVPYDDSQKLVEKMDEITKIIWDS